jgi:hypothetical protein
MNKSEIEMEQKDIQSKRVKLALISAPIMIINGLALDRKFNNSELVTDFLPFLLNDTYVNIWLVFGLGIFAIWAGYKSVLLSRRERELGATEQNT